MSTDDLKEGRSFLYWMESNDPKLAKEKVMQYYDQEAKDYVKLYTGEDPRYPANLVRLNILVRRLLENKVKTVLDVGCGTCMPMIRFLKEGLQCKGFDLSKEMINEGKKELEKAGFDHNLIFQSDLEDDSSLPHEKFDAIVASGVFPHILNEKKALSNMQKILNNGGRVFIEFRNDLFAAFTLNRYSLDFFLNKLIDLSSLPPNISEEVVNFYSERLRADKPKLDGKGKIVYADILAKFHNPLTIGQELFEPCGFSISKIHFYHYHVLPPIFDSKYPELFKELSMKMEDPNDWRGYLMASAFVVEAQKN